MIDLRDASLLDFLPESIADDAEIVALAKAIDPEMQSVGAAIIEAVILPRIDDASDAVTEELGWGFRFTELTLWDSATAAGKRNLLKTHFAVRKKSGTEFAVRRIFDLMGVTGVVVPWFRDWPVGNPYTYRLRIFITDTGITLAQMLLVPELTHRFAGTRDQRSELGVESDQRGSLFLYPALTLGRLTTIPFGGP